MKSMHNTSWAIGSRVLALITGVWLSATPLVAQPPRRVARTPKVETQVTPSITAAAEDVSKVDPKHPLVPAIALAEESVAALQTVKDYTCLFTKREALSQRFSAQTMQMKLRHTPFSVYMRFQGGTADGREVLFVEGRNQNNLMVREANGPGALLGTIPLAINSPQVAAENRHKITELGVENLARKLVKQWQNEAQFAEVKVEQFQDARVEGIACEAVRVTHVQPRKQFRFHQTVLYVNKETRIPVRVENYAWPRREGDKAPLIEEYTYVNLKPNVGLTDVDFDRRNKRYNF